MTDNTRDQISADNFRLIAVYADKFPPYVKAELTFGLRSKMQPFV